MGEIWVDISHLYVCLCAPTTNSDHCEWAYVSHPATIKLQCECYKNKKKNTCTDDILIVSYILCKNDTFFVDPSNETDLRSVITCLSFLQHTFFLQLHRFLLTVCSSAKTLASIQFEEKKKVYTQFYNEWNINNAYDCFCSAYFVAFVVLV